VDSKNDTGTGDLSVKLNRLEDQVVKLNTQIKSNKQVISELKLAISQRDTQINELELKLGYAQQSLLEKAINKIQECRVQIKAGMDEKFINPTVSQIQQHIKTAQELVDEAKAILFEKKKLVDNTILIARDKAIHCPEQAKDYIKKSIIEPAWAMVNQRLESLRVQAKTTRNLVEDKAIYPSKVMLDEIVATAQNLPDKVLAFLQAQVVSPLAQTNKKASSVAVNIYPDTVDYLRKTSGRFVDIANQALSEITDQVKKSPFWDGKNKVKAIY
jgi:CHAD domain-containing protein